MPIHQNLKGSSLQRGSCGERRVRTSFFKAGPNKIELLEATNPESPIAKFTEKRGEGIHHVAYAVEDIKAEMTRLKGEGFTLLNKEPKAGGDNKAGVFLAPQRHGRYVNRTLPRPGNSLAKSCS